jgi:hypothetical protein
LNPLVGLLIENRPLTGDEGFSVIPAEKKEKHRRQIMPQPNSPNHLKLASQSPADNLGIGAHAPRFPPAMADYTFDARPGDGSTIYVLDNGFFLAS